MGASSALVGVQLIEGVPGGGTLDGGTLDRGTLDGGTLDGGTSDGVGVGVGEEAVGGAATCSGQVSIFA